MRTLDIPYLPGYGDACGGPLCRFLPPVPPGIALAWLQDKLKPGDWVLDPFGASPNLAVEMAQAGYRVLVAVNNPVTRFILEVSASSPQAVEFQAALADLASAHAGGERLEPHIQSFYQTNCASCGKPITARAFLWERQAKAPYARLYTCPYCGDEGEHPCEEADRERLASFASGGLHRARALERVAPMDDPTRPDVEEALGCYLSRPLVVLFTLINKLDGLVLTPARRSLLTGLVLSACDQANTLWPHPTGRNRPRQLAVPQRFRENNLWLALEESVYEWTQAGAAVPTCVWPEEPPETGGISLYQGRMRDLAAAIPVFPAQTILTAFPRPNQAYWTLSALWSGWLWGRETVAPLRSVLARRRYDWNWHATALESALSSLPAHLAPGTLCFGLLAECEPSFLATVLLATDRAGFSLGGIAVRSDQSLAEIIWSPTPKEEPALGIPAEDLVRTAIEKQLQARGEPAGYSPLHAAAVAEQAAAHTFRHANPSVAVEPLTALQNRLRTVFSDRTFLTRFGGGEHTLDNSQFWLTDQAYPPAGFSDRVEMELVRFLMKNPGCTFQQIDQAMCICSPGVNTPSLALQVAVLDSYGIQDPPESGRWILRSQDNPQVRRRDLAEVNELLHSLGMRLGYGTHGENPLVWDEGPGDNAFAFYPTASTLIHRFIANQEYPPDHCLVVLPGSRSNLLAFKQHENPLLELAVKRGWRFLKFRHLRSLVDNLLLTRETFSMQVNTDPPEYKPTQLNLF